LASGTVPHSRETYKAHQKSWLPQGLAAATVPWLMVRAVTHGNNLELIEFLNYRTLPAGENGFTWAGSHFSGFGYFDCFGFWGWIDKTPSHLSGRGEGGS